MTLSDFTEKAFGEPQSITHDSIPFIVRTAGAITNRRKDGTGLLDAVLLYAVSYASTPTQIYILSREELIFFLGDEVVEKHFQEDLSA